MKLRGKIKKWKVIEISSISAVIAVMLQISGVVDFIEAADKRLHPVIIEPSKISKSEAIFNQKTICYLMNRSNKIQNNVGASIEAPGRQKNVNLTIEVEPDEFGSQKVGNSESYI